MVGGTYYPENDPRAGEFAEIVVSRGPTLAPEKLPGPWRFVVVTLGGPAGFVNKSGDLFPVHAVLRATR